PHDFARDFEQIAKQDQHPLNNKLAVFYVDGNGFTKIQEKLCGTEKNQQDWDAFIRGSRKDWLRDFVSSELLSAEEKKQKDWLGADKNGKPVYRFETLMWGGDEMLFVMPAWAGWRFAAHYFAASEQWVHRDTPHTHTAA